MHEILLQLAEIAHNKQRNTTNIQLHPRRPKVVVISSLFFSSFSLFFFSHSQKSTQWENGLSRQKGKKEVRN